MGLKEAWESFDKAAKFEATAKDPTKSDNLAGIAMRAADKKLNEAVALEAEAIAAGERHG